MVWRILEGAQACDQMGRPKGPAGCKPEKADTHLPKQVMQAVWADGSYPRTRSWRSQDPEPEGPRAQYVQRAQARSMLDMSSCMPWRRALSGGVGS